MPRTRVDMVEELKRKIKLLEELLACQGPYWRTKHILLYFGIERQTLWRWRSELGFPPPKYFGKGNAESSVAFYPIAKIFEWEAQRAALA